MDQASKNRLDWVLVAALTVMGVGLRLAYLLQVPPFLDEYSSMLTGLSILRSGGIPELPSGVLYPSGSLFSYLEALFFQLFGFSDFVARLPSLILSGLTLPILYLVARNMLNRRVALLSVSLLALSPEAVVWGGRARMYALLQLMVLLATYFYQRSVLDRDLDASRRFPAWPWVLCFIAAIFSQDEAILLLPVFWLAALVGRGPRWLLKPSTLIGQVLVPGAAVAVRYWLNEIRVPGEVYTLTHDAFFQFPPAVARGIGKIAPFFTAAWVWPISLFFLVALGFLAYDGYREKLRLSDPRSRSAAFLTYVVLAISAAIVFVVNDPWQDDRYLFMVLPLFLMVACWGLDRVIETLTRRWTALQSGWTTPVLVIAIALIALPGGLSAVRRDEPDYSAAYQWVAPQLGNDDLVATVRPAPAAVYLGRCDFLVAEDKHQEFIMRLDGEWVDRWAGAQVLESPKAFRDTVLESEQQVWFVIDEDRFESVAYSPEFVSLVLEQMELVWHEGGVLVFRGKGYDPPPEMTVTRPLDVNFQDQLRLTGYALNTSQPEPGEEVILDLYWQAIRPERNYTVFVHLVGEDGTGLAQIDGEPFQGMYGMTTHWPRDRAVTDTRRLTIPEDASPGRYRMEVGLYDADNTDAGPLAVWNDAGEVVGHSYILGFLSVNVPEPEAPAQQVEHGTLGLVKLEGYEPAPPLQVTAGATLPLTLTWQCLETISEDYTVFVHMIGRDPAPLAQVDSQPLGGAYPTSYWQVGERLSDPYYLEVPDSIPPGGYDLRVGMYLLSSGTRLPLLGENGETLGDSIPLGQVTVQSP